jgi:hypothetical protein
MQNSGRHPLLGKLCEKAPVFQAAGSPWRAPIGCWNSGVEKAPADEAASTGSPTRKPQ